MSSEIYFASAKQLADKIKQKQISSAELMQVYLDRLDVINPTLNAVVQRLTTKEALHQARLADEKLAKNQTVGPLHGLPITIKDCCKVKDFLITKGSLGLNFHPTEDATVVARLKAAGAIVIGISNVPEFIVSYETDNDRYGKTCNPYDLARTPGGSSGGEAAVIAAGGCALGLGTDGGGSIRQPAHNTGIVGLKPTRGLVPHTGNLPYDGFGLVGRLIEFGPMARFVDDLILTLAILAGPDGSDPDAMPVSINKASEIDCKSLRVAFYTNNAVASPDEATLQTINNVVNSLKNEVGQLEEHCPPNLLELYNLITKVFFLRGDKGLELERLIQDLKLEKPSRLIAERLVLERQCELSILQLNQSLRRIDQLRFELENFFAPYDIIICPVAATPAKLHGQSYIETNDFSYLSIYNLTGWPSVSVRCGTSPEGLPIGIQIIAKPWHDMTALMLAKKLETLLGGWKTPPLFP